MKNQLKFALVLLSAAPLAPALLATQTAYARPANVKVRTPKPGSKERNLIMNALRIPVTKFHKGRRVTFTNVNQFRVGGGWAHLSAQTVDANNKPLGPDPEMPYTPLVALLKWQNGGWRVVEWNYPSDVIQIDWARKHRDVPLNILGLKASDIR